jgi:predicted nucleotidyltransferase
MPSPRPQRRTARETSRSPAIATINPHLSVAPEQIAEFCRRWQITELALFGSVVRDDFRPESDVDVMVQYAPEANRGFDTWLQMRDELSALMGRPVDLVTKGTIVNPFRVHSINKDLTVIYAA